MVREVSVGLCTFKLYLMSFHYISRDLGRDSLCCGRDSNELFPNNKFRAIPLHQSVW
jgi:hypothetical protein